MALTPGASVALKQYCEQASKLGDPHKLTIREAIALTELQRKLVSDILSGFWNQQMRCPMLLDIKPQHGYRSRVIKDGFTAAQFVEWFAAGCSDVAEISTDFRGRPNMMLRPVSDERPIAYDIIVPIRSTIDGFVWVDDVIPKGLRGKG